MTPKARSLILVGGGSRSGKSAFALALARRLGKRRLFLATAQPGDAEMRDRIVQHRRERGDDFVTVEEPLEVPEAIGRHADHEVAVLDCLTLWLANLLVKGESSEAILQRVDRLVDALQSGPPHAIVVTNEVGMGIVPESPLGRTFRDLAGLAHQRLSQQADEIYLAILGTVLKIKPSLVSGEW